MTPPTLLVVDGGLLARKSFEVSEPGGMAARFLETIAEIRERFANVVRVVVAWDNGGSVRQTWFAGYKAKRREKQREWPDRERYYDECRALKALLALPGLVASCNVEQASSTGYEGDDVIATLARLAPAGHDVIIWSSDHDCWPLLIDPRVSLLHPGELLPIRGEDLLEREGLQPYEAWPAACLAGCSTDEVPGLRGVGLVKALRLLRACPCLVELLAAGDAGDFEAIREAVRAADPKAAPLAEMAIAGRATVELTARLVALYTVPLTIVGGVSMAVTAKTPETPVPETIATIATPTPKPQRKQRPRRGAGRTATMSTLQTITIDGRLWIAADSMLEILAPQSAALVALVGELAPKVKVRKHRKARTARATGATTTMDPSTGIAA